MPGEVRTALLKAYYKSRLEGSIQNNQWNNAYKDFKINRHRLEPLLSGPFNLKKEEVIRPLIFQSIADKDVSRINLLLTSELDRESEKILNWLIGQEEIVTHLRRVEPEDIDEVKDAFNAHDYVLAEKLIDKVSDIKNKTLLLIELAYHTRDDRIREKAWGSYQLMGFELQEKLQEDPNFVQEYLIDLKNYALPFGNDEDYNQSPSANENTLIMKAWGLIKNIEDELRDLIMRRFLEKYGDNWISNIDRRTVERWESVKQRDKGFEVYGNVEVPLHHYSYLGDLKEIISRNWQIFIQDLGSGKNNKRMFNEKLDAIVRVRNPLAHSRHVPENELMRVIVYSNDLLMKLND